MSRQDAETLALIAAMGIYGALVLCYWFGVL